MGTNRRGRGACALPLAWLIAACSAGPPGGPAFSAQTFGGDEDPTDDAGEDAADGTKTGAPPDSGTSGGGESSTTDGDTKGEPDQDSDPTAPETTGGESSSSGAADESSSGEPVLEPGDVPMYAPCDVDGDCESGLCLGFVDVNDEEIGSWCSAACSNPVVDCDEPIGSTATPICVATKEGGAACWLTCTGGESCPAAFQCYPGPDEDWCLP